MLNLSNSRLAAGVFAFLCLQGASSAGTSLCSASLQIDRLQNEGDSEARRLFQFLSTHVNRLYTYEALILSVFPERSGRSDESNRKFVKKVKYELVRMLSTDDHKFKAIKNFGSRCYFWEDLSQISPLRIKFGDLHVHQREVFWNDSLVPTLGLDAVEKRTLLLLLIDYHDQALSRPLISAEVWPDKFDWTPREQAQAVDTLVASLNEDFVGVDPRFRHIQELAGSEYAWLERRRKLRFSPTQQRHTYLRYAYNGHVHSLNQSESRLLEGLLRWAPDYVPRSQLERALTQELDPSPSLLNVQMLNLRRALGLPSASAGPIHNRPRVGYAWIEPERPVLIPPR